MIGLKSKQLKIKFLGQEYVFYIATKDIGLVKYIKSYSGALKSEPLELKVDMAIL